MTSKSSEASLNELIYQINLSNKAKSYDETIDLIQELIKIKKFELTSAERSLISTVYNEHTNKLRTFLLRLRGIYDSFDGNTSVQKKELFLFYYFRISDILLSLCSNLISTIKNEIFPSFFVCSQSKITLLSCIEDFVTNMNSNSIPFFTRNDLNDQYLQRQINNLFSFHKNNNSGTSNTNMGNCSISRNCPSTGESIIFYLKMLGDYYYYLLELDFNAAIRLKLEKHSINYLNYYYCYGSYYIGYELSKIYLQPSGLNQNSVRLALAGNFIAFLKNLIGNTDYSSFIAKQVLTDFYAETDNEINNEISTLIDNIKKYTNLS